MDTPHHLTSKTPRKATWLELFFDLIFVVAIAKATHVLGHPHDGHVTPDLYLKFTLIIIPVWWAWTGHTLFANRFETGDTPYRVLTLFQMLCAISLSVFINPDFDPNYQGFLLSYAAFRAALVLMYVRAAWTCPESQRVSTYLAIGFGIGVSISLSSLFFDDNWKYAVLYAGIAFDLAVPLLGRARLKALPVEPHHLPERFALLAIIVLGESVVNLSISLEGSSWNSSMITAGLAGFAIIAALWWVYFDITEAAVIGKTQGAGHAIIYGHLFIYAGLSMLANVLSYGIHPQIGLGDHKLLAILALFLILTPVSVLQYVYCARAEWKRITLEGAGIAALAGLALTFAGTPPLVVGALTIAFILYAAFGVARLQRMSTHVDDPDSG